MRRGKIAALPRVDRLILLNAHLPLRNLPPLAPGLFGYQCFEDFTVGPLSGWPDAQAFAADRGAFWRRAGALDLPDGSVMDPFVWHQVLPQIDMAEAVRQAEAEGLPFWDFEELALRARRVEIWMGDSLRDRIWRWYVATMLDRLGVGADRVRVVDIGDRPDPKTLTTLLRVAEGRAEGDRADSLRRWAELCAAPEGQTPASDPRLAEVRRLRATRLVDPETGLSPLRIRVLTGVRPDWRPMARIVADAMVAGLDAGDHVGDGVLKMELEEMARLPRPPVEIEGHGPMRNCRVRLTPFGQALDCGTGAPPVERR